MALDLTPPEHVYITFSAPSTGDKELDVLNMIQRQLEQLNPEAQQRIIGYLCRRLEIPISW